MAKPLNLNDTPSQTLDKKNRSLSLSLSLSRQLIYHKFVLKIMENGKQ